MKYAINNAKVIDPGSKYHGKKVNLLIDKGKIVEDGNHNQLIQTHGHYARLYQYQLGDAREGFNVAG